MLDEPVALKVKPRGCPLGSAALTRVSLRGFWSSSLIDGQKMADFCPLDKLHTSVPYPDLSCVLIAGAHVAAKQASRKNSYLGFD